MIINNKWRRISLKDVRAYRKADINSDHYLVVTAMRLKLKKKQSSQHTKKMNISKLRYENTVIQFQLELRNKVEDLNFDIEGVNTE